MTEEDAPGKKVNRFTRVHILIVPGLTCIMRRVYMDTNNDMSVTLGYLLN